MWVMGCLVSILTGYAGTQGVNENDTIIVVNRPDKVTLEKTANSLSVQIEGSEGNPDYVCSHKLVTGSEATSIIEEKAGNWNFSLPFSSNKRDNYRRRHEHFLGGFGFGLVNAVDAPEGMNVDMGASYELFMDNLPCGVFYLHPRTTSVSVGFGVMWRNYRMTGRTRFVKEDDNIVLESYPEGADIKFSRLKMFSLNFPLLFNQSLQRDILFSAGAVVNFNTYGSLKTRYKLEGAKVKETDKNIHQNRVTVDFTARLSFKNLGVYVKYSPTNVLNTEFGPGFKTLSAGMVLSLN